MQRNDNRDSAQPPFSCVLWDFLHCSLCLKGLKCKSKAAEVLDVWVLFPGWKRSATDHTKFFPAVLPRHIFVLFHSWRRWILSSHTFSQHVMHHRAPQSYLRLFGPSCDVNILHHWDSLTGFRVSLCTANFQWSTTASSRWVFPKTSGIRADITWNLLPPLPTLAK